MIIRCPMLFVMPRFWGEEGNQYFAYAFNHNLWDTILFSYAGYYSLFTSTATVLATQVSLDFAPYVTTYLAFLLQIIACAIVIFGNSLYWNNIYSKAIIASCIPLMSFSGNWLNSLGAIYWSGVVSFLILLENTECQSLLKKLYYRIILTVVGLTGVLSCFLMPVYLVKAIRTKVREDWIHVFLLIIATGIQAIFFLVSFFERETVVTSSRFKWALLNYDHFFNIIYFQFIYPIFGYLPLKMKWNIYLITTIGIVSILYFSSIFIKNSYVKTLQLLIFSFLIVFVSSTIFSIDLMGGPRYTFTPSIMLLVILFSEYQSQIGYRKVTAALFIITLITCNSFEYRSKMEYAYSDDWPKWADEVKLWRHDNKYPLRIWPAHPGEAEWKMKLKQY